MIVLTIESEQQGDYMATSYHADDSDGTGTPAEREHIAKLVEMIQGFIAGEGGTGSFVESGPRN